MFLNCCLCDVSRKYICDCIYNKVCISFVDNNCGHSVDVNYTCCQVGCVRFYAKEYRSDQFNYG